MADYGNWIRKRIIIIITAMGVLALLIELLPIYPILRIIALLVGVGTLLMVAFIVYVYYQFSACVGECCADLWEEVGIHWAQHAAPLHSVSFQMKVVPRST